VSFERSLHPVSVFPGVIPAALPPEARSNKTVRGCQSPLGRFNGGIMPALMIRRNRPISFCCLQPAHSSLSHPTLSRRETHWPLSTRPYYGSAAHVASLSATHRPYGCLSLFCGAESYKIALTTGARRRTKPYRAWSARVRPTKEHLRQSWMVRQADNSDSPLRAHVLIACRVVWNRKEDSSRLHRSE
jgi:hypothetical protein